MKAFCPFCLQTAPFVSKFNKKERLSREGELLSRNDVLLLLLLLLFVETAFVE